MKKIRKIVVNKILQLSQNMKRITFTGEDLKDFPENEDGGYVKFLFERKDESSKENLVRPYSIRAFRKNSLEIDIDFSNHFGDQGYATKWANKTKIGDEIFISGPGPKQNLNLELDWFLFAGDMTALPSISVHLERFPRNTSVIAVIEVLSENDIIPLNKTKKTQIKWIVKSKKNEQNFINTVTNIEWLDGEPFIWVACEYSKMVQLRNFFFKQRNINKENIYISSYWKMGLNQEEHKNLKKKDSIAWKQS